MALELSPPTLIEDAAREESWTESDWRHCEKVLREAFESSFEVTMLQRDATGLYAYGSPYANFEGVLLNENASKPMLQALGDLSRALLRRKRETEAEE